MATTASAVADVSLEELETRLRTFSQQLESIHELLESDPQNTEFLGIATDLVEVIRLTKEMIDLKLNSAEEQQPVMPSAKAAAAHKSARDPTLELRFAPGSICEAQSKGVWYPAYVESVTSSDTYNVHFLGFGTKGELAESELRAVAAVPQIPLAGALPPRDAITVGFACEAKYYADAQFYACTVTQVTRHGFQVLFSGYGNSEEVPYEYLRALPPVTGAGGDAGTATGASLAVAAKGPVSAAASRSATTATVTAAAAKPVLAPIEKPIAIPESLQILPTDSEAEKERKRKRIRAIKSANRHKTIDNERNVKQNDWKSFQHKAQRKKVAGASGVLSKRGTSMFASPETVDGRVGVVGSGQGMTAFQDARKKAKTAASIPHPSEL